MSVLSPNGKRVFLECSNDTNSPHHSSPIPLKKMKYFNAIKNIKQPFTLNKLRINKRFTEKIANDPLFAHPQSTNISPHIRWVLACKFVISSGLQLFDSYNVHGMQRNHIPPNMSFYVDNHHNLCSVIYDDQKDKNLHSLSLQIIQHCNKIETSMIQSYVATNNMNSKYIQTYIDEAEQDEDDDLFVIHRLSDDKNINQMEQEKLITIIRIPILYYHKNMTSSFYECCCRVAAHIHIVKDYGNPLFVLLGNNIANFDMFQLSVPMVPLQGSLYQMFCQFALGINGDDEANLEDLKKKKNKSLNVKEFKCFLGMYHCWKQMEYKRKCRKSMHRYWTQITETDVNIMNIVVEYADFHQMTNQRIMNFIRCFEQIGASGFGPYNAYKRELEEKIVGLSSIVDFNKSWF